MDNFLQRNFQWFLLCGILLNIPGLWLDVMAPDSALYATIAKHIAQHNDWVNLYGDGHDWLDKPHFPFWAAALSYKIFGVNGFAYKFPSFIAWLIGIYYTYKVAEHIFSRYVAQLAVVIYLVALHGVLANFDVRAEAILTTTIIAATWHLIVAKKKAHHIIYAAIWAAMAVMTKGIFVLVTIGAGFVLYWMICGEWRQFFNWRWWLFLLLTIVFITPELYCLYTQFDLHPEKVVFGKTNVSGIRFFFWDSQFGRFFNSGPIRGTGDKFFFFHTLLWAFLPWSVLLYVACIALIRRGGVKDNPVKWILYGSAIITFLLFSLSKFQLPHYIIILFPHFAILVAHYLLTVRLQRMKKSFAIIQTCVLLLIAIAAIALVYIIKMPLWWLLPVIAVIILVITFLSASQELLATAIVRSYAVAAVLYIFLFFFFYPFVLQYQSGRHAAKLVGIRPAGMYNLYDYDFEFYAPQDVSRLPSIDSFQRFTSKPCAVFMPSRIADSIVQHNEHAKLAGTFNYFHITELTADFINPKTRENVTEKRSLVYFY
ncbi:MAG: glycosyltransferase family 39 protein [Filimonas sp.]|nr:glycosyltransferase family 39 protein [Filimonas sp.]